MGRTCAFFECKEHTTGLHGFPKDRHRIELWLRAMGRSLTTNTAALFVCNKHFNVECYENYGMVQAGLTKSLRLRVDAVPNPAAFFLPSNSHKISRDFGCQTDTQLKISVGTQLFKDTLANPIRSQGSQTSVLFVSLGIDTSVHWKRPPSILSSTRQEPFQPSKRRWLTLEDVDEYDGDSIEVTDPDSTCIPAHSVLAESTTLSQASPSINDVPKYIVDEDCLLQLFEECPVCRSMCEVQKTTRESLLTIYQLCPQCHFTRNWRSQRTEKAVPSSDVRSCTSVPESSAAAITAVISFSDERDSSDEGQNVEVNDHSLCSVLDPQENHNTDNELADEGQNIEVDSGGVGDHNSDSDWDPLEHHNSDDESDTDDKHTDEKTSAFGQFGQKQLCPECGRFFFNQTQRAHTCAYKKPYSCIVCGKRYFCEYKLKVHNKTHEDGYKHVCKYCCSTFRTRTDKLLHEQSHPPAEKPYQCPDCSEVFAKIQERREHLVTHRGPTRHICRICNMEFFCNSALKRHVVVHTKEKQFVCEVCQRSFTQPNHLKSHMRVHTGEKPYQCQHCDKSFNHNVSLKSHIQRYHHYRVPVPGMKVQMEENESEIEKDEANEMESSPVDADDAKRSMETLCNAENDGEEEKKEKVGKRKRCSGRPRGRPKRNGVITLDDPNQLKRLLCVSNENEEGQGNSDSTDEEQEHDSEPIFEPSKRKRRKKKKVKKIALITSDDVNQSERELCIGDENEEDRGSSDSADEEQEHDSDPDYDPEGWRP